MKLKKINFAQVLGLLMLIGGIISFIIGKAIAGVTLTIFAMILIGMSSSLEK